MITLHNRYLSSALATLCGAGCVFALRADTVALWNFEKDEAWGTVDLRCAVNAANTFTALGTVKVTDQSVGWYLPPNPDESVDAFSSGNRSALDLRNNGHVRLVSPAMSELLDARHDFTLEGWIKPLINRESGQWYVLANINNGAQSGNKAGLIWSLRTGADAAAAIEKGSVRFEIYRRDVNDTVVSDILTDEEIVDLTNAWHHVALVFDYDNGEGNSVYAFYYDGDLKGSAKTPVRPVTEVDNFAENHPALELFGRGDGSARLYGLHDYWRLSDEVLTPDRFLCAGGTGASAPATKSSTVGYWPLGVNADGSLDVRDYAGVADLNTGLKGPTEEGLEANEISKILPSKERAFAGQPPNTTATLPSANTGCLAIRSAARLIVPGLGSSLETKNSFTVEGWFKPEERDGVADAYQTGVTVSDRYHYLFNTRSSANGWVLQYCDGNIAQTGGRRYFQLIAEDPEGRSTGGYDYLATHYFMSPYFGPGRVDWMHVALVYDHTEGKGTWRLYVDGTEWGSVENSHGPVGLSGGTDFMIGGRGGEAAFGYIDCVRVSKAALSPNQFLCATENPAAATDVLAFWPLDSQDGVSFDLSDVAGSYTLAPASYQTETHVPSPVSDDKPVITNPDMSIDVRPGAAEVKGSLSFSGNQFLQTTDPVICGLLSGQRDFTFEFYAKRTENVGSWEVLLGASPNSDGTDLRYNLTYRTTGIVLLDAIRWPNNSRNDQVVSGTVGLLPSDGEWHHVATSVEHTPGAENPVSYKFYLDGVLVGAMSGAQNNIRQICKTYFFGRDYSANSFKGQVSSVRLSDRALAPSEFLCASPAVVEDPEEDTEMLPQTLAYWAFDVSDTEGETADRSGNGYGLTAPSASGSADEAVAAVPNPDKTLPVSGRANAGSLSLNRNAASVPNLGLHLAYDRTFTVEGWIKWTRGENDWPETLFGTYSPIVDAGWKVYVDVSGATPVLRLLAKHRNDWTPVADGVLCEDVSSWNGAWLNLALSYDPSAGSCGRWTLRVDGKETGTVDNDWCDPRRVDGLNRFAFGADTFESAGQTGFAGLLDHWRVSKGVVPQDSLLQKRWPFIFTVR